ncbi:MAG: Fe-S protein assembly co-chaperone HscB [Saprospiraceae bacterium]|nr:Fe-S protein assembly co-chaperone HscB [Saprospiraceae bacterium]
MINYFEFYGLPVTLGLDPSLLKKKFYELSRSFHPDFHTLAGEQQQEEMLKQSAINNDAYQVLSNFNSRVKHVLVLFNKLKEEGENKVPQDFLMEMMELNEGLMELEMNPDPSQRQKLLGALEIAEKDTRASIATLMQKNFAEDFNELEWVSLLDYYLKSKYLSRLKSGIENISTQS